MSPARPRSAQGVAQEVDAGLTEICDSFDFLVTVSPTNVEEQWHRFERSGGTTAPSFEYRPLPFDPSRLKRLLFNLPLEEVEDDALAEIFEEKRDELDRQITLLEDRGSPRFKQGAVGLYGPPSKDLVRLAEDVLNITENCATSPDKCLSAQEAAELADEEIRRYSVSAPDFDARVEVSKDVVAGMMVSRNLVMISSEASFGRKRIEALLQHEIGIHVVTFFNGRAQPFQVFHAGLAGYESLQEGLAVFAEWLTGGVEPHRLRILAARVLAVDAMCGDADFVETADLLRKKVGLSQHAAYQLAVRVHRGGGFPKDAVYLLGLSEAHRLLAESPDWRPLLVGKIACTHIPLVESLLERGVLEEPRFLPRFLTESGAKQKIKRLTAAPLPLLLEEACS